MDKTRALNVAIGITSIAIQSCLILPQYQKISTDIKTLERRLDETNQILKEERQGKNKEFKDL
jgi:hypothetical protein